MAAREGMLAQRRGDRRLGRQLYRLQPALTMAEAPARLADADEVTQIELMAHVRQHLERKVQQRSCGQGRKR
jgi:hypothetical protein